MIDDASAARLGLDASVGALGVVAPAPTPPSTEGALPRFRRALGTTFLVHVVTALVAAVAALSVVARPPHHAARGGARRERCIAGHRAFHRGPPRRASR